MTSRELLEELAGRHGVACSYISQSGARSGVSDETIIYTLRALGVDIEDDPDAAALTDLLYADYLRRSSRPLPPCVVASQGEERAFPVHVHEGAPAKVRLVLEDGSTRPAYQDPNDEPAANVDGQAWGAATFHIPGDLPLGFHRIALDSPGIGSHECPLIITPTRLSTADPFLDRPAAGVMAQLYSVRSRESWGIGDFADLGLLAEALAPHADFLLINPLHAAEPLPPIEDSPYLPTTRRFINPLYLRIEDVPELELLSEEERDAVKDLRAQLRELNHSSEYIDRDRIFEAKLQVLRAIFAHARPAERTQQLREFSRREGSGLQDFARWCAQRELDLYAGQRHAVRDDAATLTEFYTWLQFLCDEQLARAQRRAKSAGMRIGLITDLAVGVHPTGADAVNLAEYLAPQCSVGAPPDEYNQQGQDWSQPPWHPVRLAESGYQPWRDMLSTVLRNAGGVRVDHILGLFRLYWIPRLSSPLVGTYVSYDWEAMLGILALEAERAGAVLIGEDLGTLESWVQGALASRGVLGTSIIWFEREGSAPLPQRSYRRLCLASVGTHDLPPTLAYLRGDHIALRARLGVLTRSVAEETSQDEQWQGQVFERIGVGAGDNEEAKLLALHEFIAGTPAALTCTNLVDMVGDVRAQNQPGTTQDTYPNWRVPLCDTEGNAVLIEDLAEIDLFQKVAASSARR